MKTFLKGLPWSYPKSVRWTGLRPDLMLSAILTLMPSRIGSGEVVTRQNKFTTRRIWVQPPYTDD